MTDTQVTRHQTTHMSERLSSTVLSTRWNSARLVGGGVLTWDASTEIFTWSEPLYIEFPTIPWKIEIDINGASPGQVTGITAGSTVYLELPYVDDGGANVDDVEPAGTWDVGADPTLTLAYTSPQVSTGPIPTAGAESGRFFFLASRVIGDQLILHNDLILDDGIPGAIGAGGKAGTRSIIVQGPAVVWTDIGFLYAPNQRHINVYVNGVLQLPQRNDGAVADGYVTAASADYKEVPVTGGAVGDTLYGGIEWVVAPRDSTPDTDEVVTIVLAGGTMGPPGPTGPAGGLQDAYDNGDTVDLSSSLGVQNPIEIEEAIDGATYLGASPDYDVQSAARLETIQILRTNTHPDAAARQKVVTLLDSAGNIAASGLLLWNSYGYTTYENELANTGPGRGAGVFFLGMDENVGSAVKTDKLVASWLSRAKLDNVGLSDPGRTHEKRRDPDMVAPGMYAGALHGNFVVNAAGEVATGWGRDFIRWHAFDIVFPADIGSDVYTTTFTLASHVLESGVEFLGGFATSPIDSNDYEVFFHANPSNAFVGDNPYELKLAMELSAGTWYLHVTYGSNLIGHTSKVVLFFSSEYTIGSSRPDEGDFT